MDEIGNGIFNPQPLMMFVSSAKVALRLETSDEDIFLEKLAQEGMRALDTYSIYVKKQCSLTVYNNTAKLPSDFCRLIGIRVNNNSILSQLIYVDLPFLKNFGVDTNNINFRSISGSYQIQNGYIMITNAPFNVGGFNLVDGNLTEAQREELNISNPDIQNSEPITEITLAYWGYATNPDGTFIANDRFDRAITAYICYKYCMSNYDQYNQYLIEEYRNEWVAQKAWIRSIDSQNHFNNTKRQMSSIMNAWVAGKQWTT